MRRSLLLLVITANLILAAFAGPAMGAGPSADGGRPAGGASPSQDEPGGRGKGRSADTRGQRPSETELDELAAEARERGKVRAIVGLGAELTPEGDLDQAGIAEQRGRFARLQDEALRGVSGGHRVVHRFETVPVVVLELPEPAVESLRRNPHVASVEIDEETDFDPRQLRDSTRLVGGVSLHSGGTDGRGQIVAVIDDGVDGTHQFLRGKVVEEACFSAQPDCPNGSTTMHGAGAARPCDGCEHGTHVAGIAAGRGEDFSGMAPGASIMALRVTHGNPDSWRWSNAYKALEHVLLRRQQGRPIASVNMSLGNWHTYYTSSCDSRWNMTQLIQHLRSLGVPTVISAGNGERSTGVPARVGITEPSCISHAVAVASSTKQDAMAASSQNASIVSLVAPGSAITSSVPGNRLEPKGGTSMAAPHVAGTWALVKQRVPDATVDQVLGALRQTGKSITDTRFSITQPRIQVDAAVQQLVGNTGTEPANSRFAGAVAISQLPFQHAVSTTNAVFQQGEPATNLGDCTTIGKTVWYRIVPSTSYRIDVSTAGSDFDTVVAVWRGTSLSTLQPVACNDDVDRDSDRRSRLQAQLQAGQTYYIQAGGYYRSDTNFAHSGNLKLAVSSPDVVTNPTPDPEPDPDPEPEPDPDPDPQPRTFSGGRIDASEPTAVAVRISQQRFGDGRAGHVVVSRDDVFADSLAGTPLTKDGPLLFTASHQLTPQTAAEIQRVLAPGGVVYLLGGLAAISQAVQDELARQGYHLVRLSGATRIETAVHIATEVRRRNPEGTAVAIARAGSPAENPTAAWADSVTGGAWAAATGTPILLSPGDALHPRVDEALRQLNPQSTVLFGGEAALSATVEESVRNSYRFAGAERAGTAADIAQRLWRNTNGFIVVNAYRDDGWAYGLAAAGLAVHASSPLIVVTTDRIPDATMTVVRAKACEGTPLMGFIGSRAVIGADVEADLLAAAQQRLGC